MLVAIIVSLVVGAAGGALVARWWVVRRVEADGADGPAIEASPTVVDDPLADVLRQAADRLDLGVVIGDRRGKVVFRNRAASSMSGTHVGVILDNRVDEALLAALAEGRTDKRLDLHGPPRVSLELRAEPLEDGSALATIEDVSERTRIDAMRTDFVANISHELKTPVGAIAVLAEALEGEHDPEVIGRLAPRIVEESHRAVNAIDDLLELSRIESAPLADEIVDLHEVVQAAIARGHVVDTRRNVRVIAFDAPDDVIVRADRRQLTSALGNLVENAVKYSDDDGVVQVRTRVDERNIEVMVADHGPGIPARDLDRVFERFYRVDRARSRETGGTGLGLAIVRHVATNHGGEVLVSSQEGEGSTFVLRLPARLLLERGDTDGDARGDDLDPETGASPNGPATDDHPQMEERRA